MDTERSPEPVLIQATDAWLEGYRGAAVTNNAPGWVLERAPANPHGVWWLCVVDDRRGVAMPALCLFRDTQLQIDLRQPGAMDHTLRKIGERLGWSTVACPLLEVEIYGQMVYAMRLSGPDTREELRWYHPDARRRLHPHIDREGVKTLQALATLDASQPPEILWPLCVRLFWQEVRQSSQVCRGSQHGANRGEPCEPLGQSKICRWCAQEMPEPTSPATHEAKSLETQRRRRRQR